VYKGVSTFNLQAGAVILSGGNNRLPTTTVLTMSGGSALILGNSTGGVNQAVAALNAAAGSTMSLGTNTLTAGSAPVLAGALQMTINKGGTPSNGKLVVSSGVLTYGGTLAVSSIGAALATGDSYTLFSASSYAGGFAGITLPVLPVYLGWNLSSLPTNGVITITVNSAILAGGLARDRRQWSFGAPFRPGNSCRGRAGCPRPGRRDA